MLNIPNHQPLWNTGWNFLKQKQKQKIGLPCVCVLSCVWLFGTPWTAACQSPLSMGFFRQEYLSRLSFPPPGNLPDPVIETASLVSPALGGEFFTTEPPRKPWKCHMIQQSHSWVYIWKKKKTSSLKRYMHFNVHRSIIYNFQDVEANYMSINRWMVKDFFVISRQFDDSHCGRGEVAVVWFGFLWWLEMLSIFSHAC